MGIYWAIYYALMGIAPSLIGALRERSGSAEAPLLLAAGLMGLCVVLWLVFRRMQAAGRPVA
jgi:cyanate permease